MDNGHMNGIFSGNPEITNDLNSENWQKSLEISKPVDLPAPEKIANIEDAELTTPETPVPEGPATLKNSDTELKNVYTVAKTLYDAGYTADEAALTFY